MVLIVLGDMRWFMLLLLPFVFDYTWDRLHRIDNPSELVDTVQDYIEHFPCEECRSHFAELVRTHPFPLEHVQGSSDVHIWTWLTHNLVNTRLGKEWYAYKAPC